NAEKSHRRDRLHPSQSARRAVHDPGGSKESAPRRRRQLPEASIFLAKCPAPRQIQRDLERSKSHAIAIVVTFVWPRAFCPRKPVERQSANHGNNVRTRNHKHEAKRRIPALRPL